MDRVNRVDAVEETVSELEDRAEENNKHKACRGKRMKSKYLIVKDIRNMINGLIYM